MAFEGPMAIEFPYGVSAADAQQLAMEARLVMREDALAAKLLPLTAHCCRTWRSSIPVWYCGKCDIAYCPQHLNQSVQGGHCGICRSRLYLLPTTERELAAAKSGTSTSALALVLADRNGYLQTLHHNGYCCSVS